jgi:hypothetical protein
MTRHLDHWKRDYSYHLVDGEPKAFTLGRDGAESGEGEDQDLYYPERR